MLKLIRFKLTLPAEEKINPSMSSLFHGVLMELTNKRVAASLHEDGLRPFSQCVYFDREENAAFWRIGTLTAGVFEQIVAPLFDKSKIFLRQKNWQVALSEPQLLTETSGEQIADEIFPQSDSPQAVHLQFITPTAFKHEGNYMIFPDKIFLINSLLQRRNSFSGQVKLEDINLVGKLSEFCRITRYNLHTQPFSIERVKINGFCGLLKIHFSGNDMVNRILGLLFKFAPFAGFGIKTALGMGAVNANIFWRCKDDSVQSDWCH